MKGRGVFHKMKKFTKKWALPLRWWVCFTLINIATFILFLTGFVDKINEIDFTKLSFVIYAIFYIFSIRTGVLSYEVSKTKEKDLTKYFYKNEIGWFAADSLLTIGMIGTVIGFIYMLSTSFSDLSTANVGTIKVALAKLSVGMSTALFTTAAGLICSLLLKIQLFDLNQYLDRRNNELTK